MRVIERRQVIFDLMLDLRERDDALVIVEADEVRPPFQKIDDIHAKPLPQLRTADLRSLLPDPLRHRHRTWRGAFDVDWNFAEGWKTKQP
jgi:hypothetical protein